MADDRNPRDRRKKEPPALEVEWGLPLALAPDNTYSTTMFVYLRGWWPGGRPTTADIAIHSQGEKKYGATLQFQRGQSSYPLLGLLPGHHYLVVVKVGNFEQQKLLVVEKPVAKDGELSAAERVKKLAELERDTAQARKAIREAEEEPDAELETAEKEAKLAESRERTRKASPTQLIPDSISVDFTGEPGDWTFLVGVVTGKKLIPNFPVSVLDGDEYYSFQTDSDGTLTYKSEHTEPERVFEFRVGNEPEQIWGAVLPGPTSIGPQQLMLQMPQGG